MPEGLSPRQAEILALLKLVPRSAPWLQEELDVTKQSVWDVLRLLLSRGMIARTGERRKYRYSLTEKGKKALFVYRSR